jgi:hypothetical protein
VTGEDASAKAGRVCVTKDMVRGSVNSECGEAQPPHPINSMLADKLQHEVVWRDRLMVYLCEAHGSKGECQLDSGR